MDFEKIGEKDIQEFIRVNKSVDIKVLALQKMPFDEKLRPQILQQIKAWQKAQGKVDSYTTRDGIIFPSADLVEQASSEKTARYKADICPQGDILIDLTAGLGVDSVAVSEKFTTVYCVDSDADHARALKHNFPLLSNKKHFIINGYAEKVIADLPEASCLLIDPQRRLESGKKGIYDLSQTLPDVLALLPTLREKAPFILIKTSPYLDIYEGLRQLGAGVAAVHVVEHDGQCKEVLYALTQTGAPQGARLYSSICAPRQNFECALEDVRAVSSVCSTPLAYLYEPCAALMKSGAHSVYAGELGLHKLAAMTHLYTSDDLLPAFMGRRFEVMACVPVKKKALWEVLPDKRASITVRNFPMAPEALRQKMGLKDGGDFTVFACTLHDEAHSLIVCRKAA